MHRGEGYKSQRNVRKLIIVQSEKTGIKQKVYIRKNSQGRVQVIWKGKRKKENFRVERKCGQEKVSVKEGAILLH